MSPGGTGVKLTHISIIEEDEIASKIKDASFAAGATDNDTTACGVGARMSIEDTDKRPVIGRD
jgi:hypothetical protein